MAMQSPSSSLSYGFSFDVFISFRGADTRSGFTGNLYKALCDKGIHTFMDDKELQRGDEITPSLLKSIECSRIAIIVFSKDYAASSFCLDELVHIIHCSKTKGIRVLPVFFGVEPTDVRHQSGSYAEHLTKHEKKFENNKESMERLHQWKMALTQAANLAGHHYNPHEYEYEFIEKIVEDISKTTNRDLLHVAKHPVGLQSQVQQVKLLLDKGSNDEVHMVGLYGAGGMGKSTLAKAIYNSISYQFDDSCFLEDVREDSTRNKLKHLQEKLLLKTVRSKDIELGGVSEGMTMIKKMLCKKKILLILDDVDKLEQLEALAGGLDWFGRGSRVIITSRDKHLLTCHGIERTHLLEGLYGEEARELLRRMAFKNGEVPSSYEDILTRALTYASGLPLAIATIGSNLFGRSVEDWERTLDEYEKIPNKEIQRILRVSYDALEEKEKSVFLDIACCFKGCEWREVKEILHAHYGHCIKHHVKVLDEKSLIYQNDICVTLHDLIEDMGKEVVRQQSPNLGERSRMWFHDDIVHVLKENMGTSNIEMIYLNFPSMEHIIEWNGKAFKKMKNLKTLIIENCHFSKEPKYLPSSLRLLKWKGCPLVSLSSSVLNKTFEKMKILKIDNCEYLTYISDVSCLPNLEIFSFENCKSLITIHNSIGFLSQLQILNATGCDKLLSFPPLKLNSLHELELSSCKSLKKFPEIVGIMKNIKKIILRETGIEELPFSFHNLTGLTGLTIEGCGILSLPSSILMMSNLLEVTISGYSQLSQKPNDKLVSSRLSSNVNVLHLNTSNHEFLTIAVMWFPNVEILDLTGSNIKILHEFLKECLSIKCINLNDCQFLEEIRGLPPNLKVLSALRCQSLTSSSKSMLLSQELHKAGGTEFCFPSSPREIIPEWFEHQTRESISFSFRNNLPSLVLFFSYKKMPHLVNHRPHRNVLGYYYPVHRIDIGVYLIINDNVYNSGICFRTDHTYLFHFNVQDWYIVEYQNFKSMLDEALLKNEWIHAEVRFADDKCVVESGIHVIKHLTSMDDFQFTDSSLCKKRKSDEYLNSSQSFIKSPSDEDISATPPRYDRALRTTEYPCALM